MKTLVIDNYDSFVFNLVQYIGELGGNPLVYRNDKITLKEVKKIQPTHIVLSPGPGNPEDKNYFGICAELIINVDHQIPLLGVCLGHQGIATVFGGHIIRAPVIMHGKSSLIYHNNEGVFTDLPNPLEGMRYHSLCIDPDTFPDVLQKTAWTEDGVIMGLKHTMYPIEGIQFHPESIGTPLGKQMIKNFLEKNTFKNSIFTASP